mmetsp:Transcript_104588/g.225695  ORF Transcript_104588/g.225695 Transcript_104588/m.225695 type:complete len:239 (+) Transcript_104588:698-1414(+)
MTEVVHEEDAPPLRDGDLELAAEQLLHAHAAQIVAVLLLEELEHVDLARGRRDGGGGAQALESLQVVAEPHELLHVQEARPADVQEVVGGGQVLVVLHHDAAELPRVPAVVVLVPEERAAVAGVLDREAEGVQPRAVDALGRVLHPDPARRGGLLRVRVADVHGAHGVGLVQQRDADVLLLVLALPGLPALRPLVDHEVRGGEVRVLGGDLGDQEVGLVVRLVVARGGREPLRHGLPP